jgi:threonine synthase
MDIQVSSNFERLLFEASGGDSAGVTHLLTEFRANGHATIDPGWMSQIRSEFDAGRLDDAGTLKEMQRVFLEHGRLIDPHTAVGLAVGRELRTANNVPLVVMGTADPAKFAAAVKEATGEVADLPPRVGDLMNMPEHFDVIPNDLDAVRPFLPLQSQAGDND